MSLSLQAEFFFFFFWHLSLWNHEWLIWTNKNIYQIILQGENLIPQSDMSLVISNFHVSCREKCVAYLLNCLRQLLTRQFQTLQHAALQTKLICSARFHSRNEIRHDRMYFYKHRNAQMFLPLSPCLSLDGWMHLRVSAAGWSVCKRASVLNSRKTRPNDSHSHQPNLFRWA